MPVDRTDRKIVIHLYDGVTQSQTKQNGTKGSHRQNTLWYGCVSEALDVWGRVRKKQSQHRMYNLIAFRNLRADETPLWWKKILPMWCPCFCKLLCGEIRWPLGLGYRVAGKSVYGEYLWHDENMFVEMKLWGSCVHAGVIVQIAKHAGVPKPQSFTFCELYFSSQKC